MENETIDSKKNESTLHNKNFYLESKSLLTVGCIGTIGMSTAALLQPVSLTFSFLAAWASTAVLYLPLIGKNTKGIAERNQVEIQQIGQQSILQRNRTLKRILAEDERKTTAIYSGANILTNVLWSFQMLAWVYNFATELHSEWHVSSVSTFVVMLTLSIYALFAGRTLGNRVLSLMAYLPVALAITTLDCETVTLLWVSAASYLSAFIIPSIVMMFSEHAKQPTH